MLASMHANVSLSLSLSLSLSPLYIKQPDWNREQKQAQRKHTRVTQKAGEEKEEMRFDILDLLKGKKKVEPPTAEELEKYVRWQES